MPDFFNNPMNPSENSSSSAGGSLGRRAFVTQLTRAVGASTLLLSTHPHWAAVPGTIADRLTIGQVIDQILATIPGAPFPDTVDTLKSGNPDQPVSGIVTTMFATLEVIQKAVALGANFIIAHEPAFYNHRDDTDWLAGDEVFTYKKQFLEEHKIAVWRFHDYLHAHRPDFVQQGVLQALGWEKYSNPQQPVMLTLPATKLSALVSHLKQKLGISQVRIIGDPAFACQRVALMPGAWGGRRHIEVLGREKPDLLIVGELSEWETAEYIRDARARGEKRALIILGHVLSEEPGMKGVAAWLQPKFPGIKVTHVPSTNPFTWM
jgi:putative NIF3 family GTP cyclohydrolase 1 type 2